MVYFLVLGLILINPVAYLQYFTMIDIYQVLNLIHAFSCCSKYLPRGIAQYSSGIRIFLLWLVAPYDDHSWTHMVFASIFRVVHPVEVPV